MENIIIILKSHEVIATINTENRIGRAIYDMLPITSRINTWGDELYFSLELNMDLVNPVRAVSLGDVAYSREWNAFCIFYGKTPISNNKEIIPNGTVEVIGRIDEDHLLLRRLLSGYYLEKRRRLFNRIPGFWRLAETIILKKLDGGQ